MNELPIRAGDKVADPELFALARKRFPGHRVTSQMLTDVAILENRPLHIPASPEIVAAGLREIEKDRQIAAARNDISRSYAKMNFDPTADYHRKG